MLNAALLKSLLPNKLCSIFKWRVSNIILIKFQSYLQINLKKKHNLMASISVIFKRVK